MSNTISAVRKMEYYDKIEIHKEAWSGEELFDSLLTLLDDIMVDPELTRFSIKDLILEIASEIEKIQIKDDNNL